MNKRKLITTIFAGIAFLLSYVNGNAQCDYSDDFAATSEAFYPSSQGGLTTPNGWYASSAERFGDYLSLFGFIQSPVFLDGCNSLSFKYAKDGWYADGYPSFKIEIQKEIEGVWTVVWATEITNPNAEDDVFIDVSYENLQIEGEIRVVIIRQSPNNYTYSEPPNGDVIDFKDICLTAIPPTEVAAPTFALSGHEKSPAVYWDSATVVLASATADAALYYTTDGSDPSAASTPFAAPFTLRETARVKAIGIYGDLQSTVADTLVTIAGAQSAALPFEETFAEGLGNWYPFSATGDQTWNAASKDERSFAQMTGAVDEFTVAANEDWLISPAFTAEAGQRLALRFASAVTYEGPSLALKYSTDYAGTGHPSAATWTDLTAAATWASSGEWAESGVIFVDARSSVRFAFVYTSTMSDAAQWQIASVRVENQAVPEEPLPQPGDTITLNLAQPVNPPQLSLTEKGYWTGTYNYEDYPVIEFNYGHPSRVMAFSHQIGGSFFATPGYWDGFTCSVSGDNTNYGAPDATESWLSNQWGCMAGGGIRIDDNGNVAVEKGLPYLVAYWGMEGMDDYYFEEIGMRALQTTLYGVYQAVGVYICNHPWSYYVNIAGDGSLAGGLVKDGDFFKLIIHALNAEGEATGRTVEHTLAEYKAGTGLTQSDRWEWVDLSSLGEIGGLHFTLSSSDRGTYGINTPLYFCLDKLQVRVPGGGVGHRPVAAGTPLSVYPNPFADYIMVDTEKEGRAVIYDLSGKVVLSTSVKAGVNRINTQALPKGIYVLKHGSLMVKIVK